MSFLEEFTGFLSGSTETKMHATAPDLPNQGAVNAEMRNAQKMSNAPTTTAAFKDFRRFSADAAAGDSRTMMEQIDQLFGTPGGAGLKGGAATRAKIGGLNKVQQNRVASEREFAQGLGERGDQKFANLVNTMAQFRSQTFASEVASIRQTEILGLFDTMQDFSNIVNTDANSFSQVAGGIGGLAAA